MKFTHFFIARPIFAIVLSLLMLLAGAIAFLKLPLSEYPAVTPPTVQVSASYPGANPQVIADTVAAPLEQVINGVDGMLYMNTQMAIDGRMVISIAFEQGTDPDMAQIQVQNRVSRALPRLPEEVQRIGVVTEKTSPDMLMVVHLVSPQKRYDSLYLSNFAIRQVRDELARLPGVGDVLVWGAGEYAMRVWLDPAKIANRGLTASDIVTALREQNVQVAAGSVGQQPEASAAFQMTVNTLGRLTSEEQFGEIVVKIGADGEVTRLRDIARVTLGADAYTLRSLLNGEVRQRYRLFKVRPPMRLTYLTRFAAKWMSCSKTSRRISNTGLPMILRSSCAHRYNRWRLRCWKPSCWSSLSWCCSCKPGGRPLFLWWRFPFRWSAYLP